MIKASIRFFSSVYVDKDYFDENSRTYYDRREKIKRVIFTVKGANNETEAEDYIYNFNKECNKTNIDIQPVSDFSWTEEEDGKYIIECDILNIESFNTLEDIKEEYKELKEAFNNYKKENNKATITEEEKEPVNMDRMKVLNKKEIIEALKNGGVLAYYTIYGKVYIEINHKKTGAVRFDTYLKISKDLIKVNNYCFAVDAYTMNTTEIETAIIVDYNEDLNRCVNELIYMVKNNDKITFGNMLDNPIYPSNEELIKEFTDEYGFDENEFISYLIRCSNILDTVYKDELIIVSNETIEEEHQEAVKKVELNIGMKIKSQQGNIFTVEEIEKNSNKIYLRRNDNAGSECYPYSKVIELIQNNKFIVVTITEPTDRPKQTEATKGMKEYHVSIQYNWGACVYKTYIAENNEQLQEKIIKDDAKLMFIKEVEETPKATITDYTNGINKINN